MRKRVSVANQILAPSESGFERSLKNCVLRAPALLVMMLILSRSFHIAIHSNGKNGLRTRVRGFYESEALRYCTLFFHRLSLSLSLSLFAGAGPRSTIERPFYLAFVHSTVFFSVRGQRQTGSVRTNSDAEKEREEGRKTQKKMRRAVNTHRNAYEKRHRAI